MEYSYPKGEIVWVGHYDKDHNLRYIDTSGNFRLRHKGGRISVAFFAGRLNRRQKCGMLFVNQHNALYAWEKCYDKNKRQIGRRGGV